MGLSGPIFSRLRLEGRAAFIPFITGGDPDLRATEALLPELARRGADLIEVGVPFSDPIADGPVIQRANGRALRAGGALPLLLDAIARARPRTAAPILLMSSLNPLLAFGLRRLARRLAGDGIAGVILPDLPADEAGPYLAPFREAGLDAVLLAAPTSGGDRLARIAALSTGFIYFISLLGVTGARNRLPPDLPRALARLRAASSKPVAVGFGIATPGQAAAVARLADGVVVGSALVARIEAAAPRGRPVRGTALGRVRPTRAAPEILNPKS